MNNLEFTIQFSREECQRLSQEMFDESESNKSIGKFSTFPIFLCISFFLLLQNDWGRGGSVESNGVSYPLISQAINYVFILAVSYGLSILLKKLIKAWVLKYRRDSINDYPDEVFEPRQLVLTEEELIYKDYMGEKKFLWSHIDPLDVYSSSYKLYDSSTSKICSIPKKDLGDREKEFLAFFNEQIEKSKPIVETPKKEDPTWQSKALGKYIYLPAMGLLPIQFFLCESMQDKLIVAGFFLLSVIAFILSRKAMLSFLKTHAFLSKVLAYVFLILAFLAPPEAMVSDDSIGAFFMGVLFASGAYHLKVGVKNLEKEKTNELH